MKNNLNIQISQILSVKDENINLLAAVHSSSFIFNLKGFNLMLLI